MLAAPAICWFARFICSAGFGEAPLLPPGGDVPWNPGAFGPGGAPGPAGPPGPVPVPRSCSWRAIISRFLFCCSSNMSCI